MEGYRGRASPEQAGLPPYCRSVCALPKTAWPRGTSPSFIPQLCVLGGAASEGVPISACPLARLWAPGLCLLRAGTTSHCLRPRSLLHSLKAQTCSSCLETGLGLLRESLLREKDHKTSLKAEENLRTYRRAWARDQMRQPLPVPCLQPAQLLLSVPQGCFLGPGLLACSLNSASWKHGDLPLPGTALDPRLTAVGIKQPGSAGSLVRGF